MECKNCGKELAPHAKFCSECACPVSVEEKNVEAEPKSTKCPNIVNGSKCGALIIKKQKFCSECAWKITDKAFEDGSFMCFAKGNSCKQILGATDKFCSSCNEPAKQFDENQKKEKNETARNAQKDGLTTSGIEKQELVGEGEVVDSDMSGSIIQDNQQRPATIDTKDNTDDTKSDSNHEPFQKEEPASESPPHDVYVLPAFLAGSLKKPDSTQILAQARSEQENTKTEEAGHPSEKTSFNNAIKQELSASQERKSAGESNATKELKQNTDEYSSLCTPESVNIAFEKEEKIVQDKSKGANDESEIQFKKAKEEEKKTSDGESKATTELNQNSKENLSSGHPENADMLIEKEKGIQDKIQVTKAEPVTESQMTQDEEKRMSKEDSLATPHTSLCNPEKVNIHVTVDKEEACAQGNTQDVEYETETLTTEIEDKGVESQTQGANHETETNTKNNLEEENNNRDGKSTAIKDNANIRQKTSVNVPENADITIEKEENGVHGKTHKTKVKTVPQSQTAYSEEKRMNNKEFNATKKISGNTSLSNVEKVNDMIENEERGVEGHIQEANDQTETKTKTLENEENKTVDGKLIEKKDNTNIEEKTSLGTPKNADFETKVKTVPQSQTACPEEKKISNEESNATTKISGNTSPSNVDKVDETIKKEERGAEDKTQGANNETETNTKNTLEEENKTADGKLIEKKDNANIEEKTSLGVPENADIAIEKEENGVQGKTHETKVETVPQSQTAYPEVKRMTNEESNATKKISDITSSSNERVDKTTEKEERGVEGQNKGPNYETETKPKTAEEEENKTADGKLIEKKDHVNIEEKTSLGVPESADITIEKKKNGVQGKTIETKTEWGPQSQTAYPEEKRMTNDKSNVTTKISENTSPSNVEKVDKPTEKEERVVEGQNKGPNDETETKPEEKNKTADGKSAATEDNLTIKEKTSLVVPKNTDITIEKGKRVVQGSSQGENGETETKIKEAHRSAKQDRDQNVRRNQLKGADFSNSRERLEPARIPGVFTKGTSHQQDVLVIFHAIASKAFLQDSRSRKVMIEFQSKDRRDWDTYLDADIERELPNNEGYKISCTAFVPRYKTIYYNYIVKYQNADGFETEYYYRSSLKPNKQGYLRSMIVTSKAEIWHQYDGVINVLPGQNVLESLASYFCNAFDKSLAQDLATFAKYCCPLQEYFCKQSTAPVVLQKFEMMISGLENEYKAVWKNQTDFKKEMGIAFSEAIKPGLDEIRRSQHIELNTGALLLYVRENFSIDLPEDIKEAIYKSFILDTSKEQQVSPRYESLKKEFDDHSIELITNTLIGALRTEKKSNDPIWLCCLPVYHFLSGRCIPFEESKNKERHDANTPTWWGIEFIKEEVDYLKGKSSWRRTPMEMLKLLQCMFEMDYLLPRAFVATLTFQGLESIVEEKIIPPEVILAAVYYYLVQDISKNKKTYDITKGVIHCLKTVIEHIQVLERTIDSISQATWTRIELTETLGCELLSLILQNYRKKEDADLVVVTVKLYLNTVSWYGTAKDLVSNVIVNTGAKHPDSKYHEIHYPSIESWANSFSEEDLGDYLKVMDPLLAIDLKHQELQDSFRSEMKKKMEASLPNCKRLSNQQFVEVLITTFCDYGSKYNDAVQEVLGKVTVQAMEKGNNSRKKALTEKGYKKYGNMMSQMFERKWNEHVDPTNERSPLFFALSWAPITQFFEIFYERRVPGALSNDCQKHLTKVAELVENTKQDIFCGNIRRADLELVQNAKDRFLDINAVLWQYSQKTTAKMDSQLICDFLKLRIKEIERIDEVYELINEFIHLCQHFDADLSAIDPESIISDNQRINNVIKTPKTVDESHFKNIDRYQPVVQIENISDELIQALPEIKRLSQGTIFLTLWIARGREKRDQTGTPLQITEIFTEVWKPVLAEWLRTREKIRSGDITFKEFESMVGALDVETIKKEMQFLEDGKHHPWIFERLEQIEQYKILKLSKHSADVFLSLVKDLNLKGEFGPIRKIIEMDQNADVPMKQIDKSMIQTCGILKKIKPNQIGCIEMLGECKILVEWLKNSMEDLQELTVFVDLASMSAGEGDMEVGKVNCLLSAATGYAPLIFNLDESCDYKQFIANCEQVWKGLEADPNLPEKLMDTLRNLEWFQSVKEKQGSVEISSVDQAKSVNASGIYFIGKMNDDRKKQKLNIEDVLQLHMQEDSHGSRLRQTYSYKDLQELQSKLMLVAGKAEKGIEDVERFTLVFESVVRLAVVYIKLVESGCVLFTHWQAKFLCDPSRTVCAFIKFGTGKNCKQLKGRRSEKDDVSTIMPELAKFMENCLDEWQKYIDIKRDQYFHLNYFTIDQLVILQKELSKLNIDLKPSELVFPLLSSVKSDCSLHDVSTAMEMACEEVDEKENQIKEQTQEFRTEQGGQSKIINFIYEMAEAGYKEKIARAALESGISPDDTDKGLEWCMENEQRISPQKAVERRRVFTTTDTILEVNERILNALQSQDGDSALEPLLEDLDVMWKKFQTAVSSNLADYLSVEHLGIVLKHLSSLETIVIQRDFLSCFEKGNPNLLMCPSDDVINTVLSIYCHDTKQPLPNPDEVLLCTQDTTINEVDNFWRRSMFDHSGKIYCMANVERLNYEVSDEGERRLQHHIQASAVKGTKYRLVIVCGIEREEEFSSRIVAALDKFRRPPLPLMSYDVILPYVREKLVVDAKKMPISPASAVDFESCSVRVIKSWRPGVGKSLYKRRLAEELQNIHKTLNRFGRPATISIPIHEKKIKVDDIMQALLKNTTPPNAIEPRIFHIDLSHEVEEGVDYLLFQLLVLGCLTDSFGYVWKKSPLDLYLVESMPILANGMETENRSYRCLHRCLDILPDVVCRSPLESYNIYRGSRVPDGFKDSDVLFDGQEFESDVFQRPFQYLDRMDTGKALKKVNPNVKQGTPQRCLHTLLKHCGILDPSWSELRNFVWFLNTQLKDFEHSDYISDAAAEFLPGFAKFALKFLIQMSRDFATRSLHMSEETSGRAVDEGSVDTDGNQYADIRKFQMKRTWESSPHPYLFFNPDRNTMTFVGFTIDRWTGNLKDYRTGRVIERAILPQDLGTALYQNNVNMNENFDKLSRGEKLKKLCTVMGLKDVHDPDNTYELTMDNVKKILAIYMRFRCDIPVIVMGETGCGKTRLIQFMCQLQCPPGEKVESMLVMKVHGGTKPSEIINKVREAEQLAEKNSKNPNIPHLFTVLFFDEANTTEAIGVIKEIMCDKTICGEPVNLCQSLKIVAACNPYRRHSAEMVERLEQAGLGYHVDVQKTKDKLGRIPMRRLVYRVQPLPQSLLPLVWDFGQLDTEVEKMYIRQMVLRFIEEKKLPHEEGIEEALSKILSTVQNFMRDQKDECSFVSLRNVERALNVISWFCKQDEWGSGLLHMLDIPEKNEDENEHRGVSDLTKSLVLALGVCYHACLKKRKEFRESVTKCFDTPFHLPKGHEQMLQLIERCQNIFLKDVKLGENIARNKALRENIFMMVVCIELKIPLFLVGKPGSSKSLAKTIVADAMQGNASHSKLFRHFKQVKMVSFQCSPLSIAEGIIASFRQCANFQKDKDLSRFVSVVVLDEVGLAEDSPKMPLKTLHPLLEDGCQGDEKPEAYKKVGFIGISNWALDPAKMNRGIHVQRETPEFEELNETAMGICCHEKPYLIEPIIVSLAAGYLDVFKAVLKKREFFGLRDFYSLIKMMNSFTISNRKKPTWWMLKHCILRNFGGFEEGAVDPLAIFEKHLKNQVQRIERPLAGDPDCSPTGLIKACLEEKQSRYLLLLTENFGALSVLQQKFLKMQTTTIFGSSFPSDQQYTQVCRNINRVKVCMETGVTVILLNLENLYESLYDALNQYYVTLGGEKYVDLGLGSHRVKCRVHKDFRLIVVAEKETVYKKFPIPLINRLEKHFLNISTMLSAQQVYLMKCLEEWAEDFVTSTSPKLPPRQNKERQIPGIAKMDAFMGYHDDTCASIVLHACKKICGEEQDLHDIQNDEQKGDIYEKKILEASTQILDESKNMLLWCATPDSVLRLGYSKLHESESEIRHRYFYQQNHESLLQYMQYYFREERKTMCVQVTTHSKLLTSSDVIDISYGLNIEEGNITLLSLQSFDTEQQFCRQIRCSFEKNQASETLLIVQCANGVENGSLIACARYCVLDQLHQLTEEGRNRSHVVFVIHLPRMTSGYFTGFQCGVWQTIHIDDIKSPENDTPKIMEIAGKSIGTLLEKAAKPTKSSTSQTNIEENIVDSDVETSFSRSVRHTEQAAIHRRFNFPALVKLCAHSSLAMVKDPSDPIRSTNRVKILIELLHHADRNDDASFMMGVCLHLITLMKEKEEEYTGEAANIWLTSEATSREHINRVGTFRQAMTQCVVNKLSPLLAGIISKIDTNRNLDILKKENTAEWKRDLWLNIINCQSATDITYSMFISPNGIQMKEFSVFGTGFDGHMFSCKVPFSWLIHKLIQSAVEAGIPFDSSLKEKKNQLLKISTIIESRPLGRLLSSCLNKVSSQDFVDDYVHDFIHMVYQACKDDELEMVCRELKLGVNLVLKAQTETITPIISLVAVHVAHGKSLPVFQNFCKISQVWPNCSSVLQDFLHKKENGYLLASEKQILDILGLFLLLRSLDPAQQTFTETKSRQKWNTLVNKYRPVVERMLDPAVYHSRLNISESLLIEGSDEERCQACKSPIVERFVHLPCNHIVCMDCFKECLKVKETTHVEAKCVICDSDLPKDFQPLDTETCRYHWTRVIVVKLFLEHVCATHDFHHKRCMTLWKMMKGDADLKTFESLGRVEKFLKLCLKAAMHKAFGDQEECKACESPITERPVQLPCGDVICVLCFKEAPLTGSAECPVCHQEFPKDFKPLDTDICSPEIREFNSFKKCCNRFYMDVVSQLCFSEDSAPSKEVVDTLLSHITIKPRSGRKEEMMSKEISIFDEGMDSSPILRSFLLQHLLRTNESDVETYLEKYLMDAQSLFKNDKSVLVQLCVMIIDCLEDSYVQECSKGNDLQSIELKMAMNMLEKNLERHQIKDFGIEKVIALSESRFGLKVAAYYLHKIVNEHPVKENLKVLDAALRFCSESETKQPKIFVIKHICRSFGIDHFQELCKSKIHPIIQCLDLPELQMEEIMQCSDRFIVCGSKYKEVREALTASILGNNQAPLKKAISSMNQPAYQQRIIVLLAIFREVTLSHLFENEKRRFPPENEKRAKEALLMDNELFEDQMEMDLLSSIWENKIRNDIPFVWVNHGMNLRHQNMTLFLYHFYVTLAEIPTDDSLLQTFWKIVSDPSTMRRSFLPTMPQDDTSEIINIIFAQSEEGRPIAYRCPNNHPYFIGDCGMPTTMSRCPDCGEEIGGEEYKLREKNKKDAGKDSTTIGHILGDGGKRQLVATPERDLEPIQCTILRLLTHASMYLGSLFSPKPIQRMIKPRISEANVQQFLWKHLEVDISILQNATGKSAEDIYLFLHGICNEMAINFAEKVEKEDICIMETKQSRREWEKLVADIYFKNALKDMDDFLSSTNAEIANDQRLASDPLMCLLIEEEIPRDVQKLEELHAMPFIWRYRSQITIPHLSRTLLTQTPSDSFTILKFFLDEEHHLKAIRFIPSIIRLQKTLIKIYQDKLDKNEAAHMTIDTMLNKEGKEDDLKTVVYDFMEAWRCVREHLAAFSFVTPKGKRQFPIELSERVITEKDSVSYLLPTFQGKGLCSYALLYFLVRKQNDFLMEYCRRKNMRYKDLPKVHLKDITAAHLIYFHPTKDLLPMILANCQYTFEPDKGTRIEYNFDDLERQIMDRVLFSKSVIEMSYEKFQIMTYSSDKTNAVVFKDLRRRVKQEPLAPILAHQICDEFGSYPEICDTLKQLDIAISFLKTVGGESEMSLETFMTDTLQIENPFPTPKVKTACQCKHAQALWIALTMTKTKHQSSFQEDAFESVSDELKKELGDTERKAISKLCDNKPLEKLNTFIEVLFECIMLQITLPADEEYDMGNYGLKDTLREYRERPSFDKPLSTSQDIPDISDIIEEIPNSIRNNQATYIWLCVYTLYTQKPNPTHEF